jgi:hypothetical protein
MKLLRDFVETKFKERRMRSLRRKAQLCLSLGQERLSGGTNLGMKTSGKTEKGSFTERVARKGE